MFYRAVFRGLTLVFGLCLMTGAVADPSACLNCHAVKEFSDMDAETVAEALADASIPSHRHFAGLTEAEVEALLEALAE